MSAIAIIPARGGSRRIPLKNIRKFHGRPIIAYSIETARASGLFSDIVVSTDDDEIGKRAWNYGATVYWRSGELALDDVGTQAVVRDALQGSPADYACCIYATAPMMTVKDLHGGLAQLRRTPVPYVYSVGPDWRDAGQWYWGRTADFLAGTSLDQAGLYGLPAERVCDINTPEDWERAERMYAALHKEERTHE